MPTLINYAALAPTAFGIVYLWANRTHRYKRGYSQVDGLGFVVAMAAFVLHTMYYVVPAYYWTGGPFITLAQFAEWLLPKFGIYFLAAVAGWASVSVLGFRGIGDVYEGLRGRDTAELYGYTIAWAVIGVLEHLLIYLPAVLYFLIGDPEDAANTPTIALARTGYWLYAGTAILTPTIIGAVNALIRYLGLPGIYDADTKQTAREVFKAAVWTVFNVLAVVGPGIVQIFPTWGTYQSAWTPGTYTIAAWPFYPQLFVMIAFLLVVLITYLVAMFMVSEDERETARDADAAYGPRSNVALFGMNLFQQIGANRSAFLAKWHGYDAVKRS